MKTLAINAGEPKRVIVGTFSNSESTISINRALHRLGIAPPDAKLLLHFLETCEKRLVFGKHELVKNGTSVMLFKLNQQSRTEPIRKINVLHEGIQNRTSALFLTIEDEINRLGAVVEDVKSEHKKVDRAVGILADAYERAANDAGEEATCEFFSRMISAANSTRNGLAHKALMGALADRLLEHEEFEALERLMVAKKLQLEMKKTLLMVENVVEYYKWNEKYDKAVSVVLDIFYQYPHGTKSIKVAPTDLRDAFTDKHFIISGKRMVFPTRNLGSGTANELRRIFDGIWSEAKENGAELGNTKELVNIWLGNLVRN